MKASLRYLAFLNIISLLLLSVSGILTGAISKAVYALAFVLPLLLGSLLFKRTGKYPIKFHTGRGDIKLLLPLIFPTILLVFALSALTSLVLSFFGFEEALILEGSIFTLILDKALLPALLEEGLYRYLIIAMLAHYSKRGAVIYSALFFAFAHCSLFQLPYALLAGLIFAFIDLMLDSILPSLIFHFLNNVMSLLWLRYFQNAEIYFVCALVLLSLISLVFIILNRKSYAERIERVTECDGKIEFSYEIIVFIAMTGFVALTNLF